MTKDKIENSESMESVGDERAQETTPNDIISPSHNKRAKLQLTFKNVTIRAPIKQRRCCRKGTVDPDAPTEKVILDDLSGTIRPGEFLAILGASGAGKTTLLNYLSQKDISRNLKKTGQVLVNGKDVKSIDFKRYIAYVQQDDILFQTLTVRECLMFAARLKLPGSENYSQKVEDILDDLKLKKAADTKIGGPLVKGISGGERKRTSIGVELITDPNLIFLDEPTTGLDSFTATTVVEVLRDMARQGRTVISTIHQPNSDIFNMFDQLMLMAKGKIIYFNKANKSETYFQQIGYPVPELSNPADYYMAMMSIESYDVEDTEDSNKLQRSRSFIAEEYQKKIDYFDKSYQESELKCDADFEDPDAPPISQQTDTYSYKANICKQYILITQRSFKNLLRIPITSYVKLASTIIVSLMIILIFQRLEKDVTSIQNRTGVLFFFTLNTIFNSIQGVILVFPDERGVFLRENASGMYNVLSYYLGKVTSEIPNFIIFPTLMMLICYFILGLVLTWDAILTFWLISCTLSWAASGLGLIIGAAVPNKQVAVSLIPIVLIPFMLFAGFFVNQDNIPFFLIPFQYISLFKYGLQCFFLVSYLI